MNGNLDPTTEINLQEAADLCGVSDKTLRRDYDDPQSPVVFIKRGTRNYVTIQMLIDAGRYTPGKTPASTLAECAHLRERVAELQAENAGLRERLAVATALGEQAVELFRLANGAPSTAGLKAVR